MTYFQLILCVICLQLISLWGDLFLADISIQGDLFLADISTEWYVSSWSFFRVICLQLILFRVTCFLLISLQSDMFPADPPLGWFVISIYRMICPHSGWFVWSWSPYRVTCFLLINVYRVTFISTSTVCNWLVWYTKALWASSRSLKKLN